MAQAPAHNPPADVRSPAPSHPYSTRPYPVAGDPAKGHADQLEALAAKLEQLRANLGTQLDADSLALLSACVTELAGLSGRPAPVAAPPPPPPE